MNTSMQRRPGYDWLRRGRVSIAGATYFITLCTHERRAGLTDHPCSTAITAQLRAIECDHAAEVTAAIIMPEHVHFLLILTGNLAIGQIVARLKFKTRLVLASIGLRWQGNYFEHRLRSADMLEDVIRYMFLNPYAAGLLPREQKYLLFWTSDAVASWFDPTLDDGRPFPEWLA
jgi:putative transposase